ncbi:MAG: DMT family transporter [bacterium]
MNKKAFGILVLGVACLATGGIFVKLSEVQPIATAFYRILLAMPLAFIWARASASPRPRAGVWNVPRGDFALMICSGAFLAFDLILWHISFHHTTVANANLLANLVPFVVVPVSWLLFGNRPSSLFLLGLVVATAGVVVLMSGKINPSRDNFLGDFLAIATAVFYGLYLITVGKLRARYNAGDILFWGGWSSLAILLAASLIWEQVLLPQTMAGVAVLVGLAAFSQIGGQGLLAVSFDRLPINFASVAVLMQPVIAACYAFAIFSETLSRFEIIGIGVVLLGIYVAKMGSTDFAKSRRAEKTQ